MSRLPQTNLAMPPSVPQARKEERGDSIAPSALDAMESDEFEVELEFGDEVEVEAGPLDGSSDGDELLAIEQAFFAGHSLDRWAAAPAKKKVFDPTSLTEEQVVRTLNLGQQGAMLGRLKGYGPRFVQALECATHSEFSKGNRIDPLFDGKASFDARRRMILDARDSIHLQTFIFTNDETGRELASLLSDKARQGVQVRVIVDAVGSNRDTEPLFRMMREAGVQIREWGQLWELDKLNSRMHEKYLIADGIESIQGGMNIANEYAYGGTEQIVTSRADPELPWRDVDCLLRGPEVRDLQIRFLRNWAKLGPDVDKSDEPHLYRRPPALSGGCLATFVSNHPSEGTTYIEAAFHLAVCAAQKSIHIETAYFVPSDALLLALKEAAQRGVVVEIMTNSLETNDVLGSAHVSRSFYADLIASGVRIYEHRGATLHSKTLTCDGELTFTGSANFNSRGRELDTEFILCAIDPKLATAYEDRFKRGVVWCDQITSEVMKNWSALDRAKQWAFSKLKKFY